MKNRTIQIPIEEKLNKEQEIIKYLGNKSATSLELTLKLNIKGKGLLSDMVRYGTLEVHKCDKCKVGKLYGVKK